MSKHYLFLPIAHVQCELYEDGDIQVPERIYDYVAFRLPAAQLLNFHKRM